ncbi:hypothetical protein DIPPA_04325 [Diplonema papillatum]|nr:hypothetical protein DIPPA_04325 [Diplonema papillatum]KAJ9451674.1 hypothetical protein DIPPA_04325 [Diplonema papillatum]
MTVLHISDKQSSPAALCISLNVNERFEYEEGTTLFFLRDSECSCLITTSQEDFFTDRWLHLVFVIRDAPGNSVHLKVDGRESRLSIRAAEGPKVFDKWDPYLVLGGEVQTHTAGEAEPSKLEKLFSGRLADVKLWSVPSAADASLKFHWNLSEDPQDPSAAPDSVGKAPGAISGPGWLPVSFPDTSLYFNGVKTFVNLSPLGDFGQKLAGGFRFEFWVRVTNSSAAMSVLKTTDTAQKRMVIGFDLNTNALSQHQKGCTLLTVRDAAGSELVAFQSAVDLCDQKWHRIEWEVSPPQDTMSLRVDGFSVNLDYHKCEAPSVFVSFSQFLCLGGYNNRGAVQNPFQGFIRDVKVASCKPKDAYAPVAYWKLDEGAGACLAMDSTGNGNNGVVYDRGPRKKCATWLAVDLPDALKPENAVGFLADSICTPTGRLFPYEDNAVSVSALRTAMVADECGIHREVVLDVAGGGSGGKKVALAPVELAAYGERRGGEMVVLSEVPPDAFHPAKGYADAAALAGCGEGGVEAPGTTAVTVMLGAGRLTVVSLIGHNRRSRDVWDPALAEWQAPVALISADDKISLSSNRAAAASSKLLMHLGTSPALFRRAHRRFAPSDEGGAAVDVIKHGCFSVEESYFVLVRVADPAAQTPCEANYARWFVDGVAAATRGHAAVVVQKQVRRLLAAARAAKVRAERSETERRRLLREATRLEQPQLACVRDERVAFFVDGLGSTHPPDSSRARAGASREGNGCKQAEGAAPAQNPAAQSAPASLPGAAKPAPATATTLHPETSGNGSGGGGGGGKALGPHAHAASVARQAVALAVAMRAEGWQIEHLACETPAAILASVAAAQAAAAGGKVVFYCFTGFAGFETPYGVSRTREELHSLVAADEGKHRVLLEKDEQREFGGLVAGDEAEREEAERERAAREMEDKELQKEMRRKELDARLDARRKGSNRWVTSTKVVDPKGSRPGGKGGPSGRSATDEELSLAEQKTPLPFSPSATPALADLPPEEAWDPAPRTYLCPAAPPLVPNPRNTADFAAVTAALRAPAGTLGHHFIAAVQCLGAPNTGSDGFAYLSYSNGDEVMWGGEESAQFLGVYLARLFTGRGTVSTAKLLRYPPRDGNKPGAERGVSWDSFYDYISARMGKRGCRVVRSDRPDTYIGDLILADRSVKRPSFAGNAARKRATAAMHGGVVTFLLRPDSASYAPQRAYLAEKLAHLLNSDRFSAQVEAAPPPPETEHTLLLAFAGAISDASPPLTPRADWEAYLDRLSGKIKKSKFTYALHPGPTPTAFTVSVTFSDPEPVSRIVAAVLGSVDVSLQPSGLPLPPFVPTGCSVPQSLDFIAPIASLQRLQKASISGQLAAVLSLVPGVAFVDFRQATDGELAAMDERSRHVKSIKKKEADARKNNLSPNDQRRKDIEEKRRSLRGSV